MLLTAVLIIMPACLDDIERTPLIDEEAIPAPLNVRVSVGDGIVDLAWSSVAEAVSYRVYRSTALGGSWTRIAQTADTVHVDANVENGRQYLYTVTSVSSSGLESVRSDPATAVPAVYSLLINGGTEYCGTRTVTLTMTAPSGTALMRIGNLADLTGQPWRTYQASTAWELSAGDGTKTVHAQFQDESGAFSPAISSSVILDTYVGITGLTVTPQPRVYAPGATIHMAMTVEDDETGGEGIAQIEGLTGSTIRLGDEGRGGDVTAGDGVYEVDFQLPLELRGTGLIVSGGFVDRAGNEAQVFESPGTIDITDPPMAVQLIGVIDSTTSRVTIRWAESTEEHFLAYRIYRSEAPGVTETPTMFLRGLDNRSQTSYPDTDVKEAKTYYYRIFVVNDLEETAGSNEIVAHTADAYPTAVTLDDPSAVGATRLTLTWSVNPDTDFHEYRIYRSTSPGVTESSVLVATIDDQELTWHDDAGIDTIGNTYYYRVFTYDVGGKSSRSNEVSTTP
jgi:fibronectin type 3 domain-containing protein